MNCEKKKSDSDLNKNASLIIEKTIGKFHNDMAQKIRHELIPCHNLPFRRRTLQNEINKYSSSYPIPICFQQTLMDDSKLPVDLVEDLIVKKYKWKKKINDFKQIYRNNKKIVRISLKEISTGKNADIPDYLTKFVWNLKKDPDKYFDGIYNWWYTNGNLNVLNSSYQEFLIHVSDSTQKIIDISTITKADNVEIGPKISSITLADKIYSLKSTFLNNGIIVGCRHRNEISFNFIPIDNEKNILDVPNKIQSNIPFTSFDLNKDTTNNFYTADVNRIIKVWDVNVNKEISEITCFKNDSMTQLDNWNDIKYLNTNTLMFIDRQNVRLLDTRCPSGEQETSFNFKFILENCDKYSFMCQSNLFQNMSYIGSYHSVILSDFRNPKSFVHKWTHLMKSVPFIAETKLCSSQEEVLCFSSQISDEKSFLFNSLNDCNESCISSSIPLLTLEKSLNDSQLQGKCVQSYSLINKRIHYCTSGLALMQNCDDIFIFSQNSIGDVFRQKISNTLIDSDYELSNLNKLSASMNLKTSKKCHLFITSMTPMNHIVNSKTQNCLKHKLKSSNDDLQLKSKQKWRKDIDDLKQYVDFLAPNILQAWGFEVPIQTEHLPHSNTKQTSNEKVTKWLKNVSEVPVEDLLINSNLEESKDNVAYDVEKMFIENNNSQNIADKLHPSKKKPLRKRHIQGF